MRKMEKYLEVNIETTVEDCLITIITYHLKGYKLFRCSPADIYDYTSGKSKVVLGRWLTFRKHIGE